MVEADSLRTLLEEETQKRFGEEAEPPEVEFLEEEGYPQDYSPGVLSDGVLVVNEENIEEENLEEYVSVVTDRMADRELGRIFRESLEELEEMIDSEVAGKHEAYFKPMSYGAAAYDFAMRKMTHDKFGREKVVPGTGEVTSNRLERNIRHEGCHALQGENPAFGDLRADTLEDVEHTAQKMFENDLAGVEALPIFEEDPKGEGIHELRDKYLDDPWKIPDFLAESRKLRGLSRINGGGGYILGDHLYSGPYAMAETIAYTVKNHFKRQESVNDPVEETKKTLLDIAADADQWERMLEDMWRGRDIPNYHELFRKNYKRIQNDSKYAKRELSRLENELRESETDLDTFYEAKSFVHAYRETGRENTEDLDRIEDLAFEMYREQHWADFEMQK